MRKVARFRRWQGAGAGCGWASRSACARAVRALCPEGRGDEANPKPPRASLPKGWSPESMTLERALQLLSLPRLDRAASRGWRDRRGGIGRFGPYVKHGSVYANLPDVEEVFTIGMNRAVEVLAQKATRGAARRAPPLRGAHARWRAMQVPLRGGRRCSVMPGGMEPGMSKGGQVGQGQRDRRRLPKDDRGQRRPFDPAKKKACEAVTLDRAWRRDWPADRREGGQVRGGPRRPTGRGGSGEARGW
jgi:hypothetical protein